MHSLEQNPEIQNPSLDNIEKQADITFKEGNNFLVEGVPQMEACVDRNQLGMNSFCIHDDVGLFSFDNTKHLLPKS